MSLESLVARRDKRLSDLNDTAELKMPADNWTVKFLICGYAFVVDKIIFKMVAEELRLRNNCRSYRRSKMMIHVAFVARFCEVFTQQVFPTRKLFRCFF
jgi:hypothetical protein